MATSARTLASAAAIAAGAVFASAACAQETHYVGAVNDELFIAVAVAQDTDNPNRRALMAYLCDSESIWHWHGAVIEGDSVELEDGRMTLTLELAQERLVGNLVLDETQPQEFRAEVASGDAGLFVYADEEVSAMLQMANYAGGWIVLNNLEQRGAVAFATPDGAEWVWPPIDPMSGSFETEFGPQQASPVLHLEDCFTDGTACPLN